MIYPSEDKIQCGIAPALQGARSIGRQGVLNIPKGLFYYAIVLHGRETLTTEASSSRPPNDSNFSGFPGIQVKGRLLTLRTRRCCELPELLGARTDAGPLRAASDDRVQMARWSLPRQACSRCLRAVLLHFCRYLV